MVLRTRNRWRSLCARLVLVPLILTPAAADAGPFVEPGVAPESVIEWADAVLALERGPVNLAEPTSPLASDGVAENAVGPTGGETLSTVSLGDGGAIVLSLSAGAGDGPGPDLTVFENGFWTLGGLFAELAFVEVSTDGVRFARLPAVSLTAAPVAGFEPLDPTDVHGLAGKHPAGEGTPFDLHELANDPAVVAGAVDLSEIFFVRVVDVIGDGSATDRDGMPVFDPFPTPFPSSGFDLDAVGVLNPAPEPAGASPLLAGFALLGVLVPRRRARRLRRTPASPRVGLATLAFALTATPAGALTVDFEDLSLAPESAYVGADGAGGFTSRGVSFRNEFTDFGGGFTAWRGFGYSNRTDRTTPGFGSGTSAFAGGGAHGSTTYAVASAADPEFATLTLPEAQPIEGASLANTTYSALSMLQGDAFAKKFGGPDGTDPDFFSVTITGRDATGAPTGAVEFFLADFRFEDDALDYVLDGWAFVDLSSLGPVSALTFSMASSDVGEFGMNTPATFALDDILVMPEPATGVLVGLGLAALLARAARRR